MRCSVYGLSLIGGALLFAGGAPAGELRFPRGVDWQAVSLNQKPFAAEALPSLNVADGRASGTTGCNRYTGNLTVNGAKLAVGPMAMTKMFCHGPGGDNERRFVSALGSAQSWTLKDKVLTIETAHGTLRFERK